MKHTTPKKHWYYSSNLLNATFYLYFSLCCFSCFAQSFSGNTVRFEHFSADHGLSQTTFQSILQDRKGYMWFGTQNGLIKYDGYTFTTFQFDPLNKYSIQSNSVQHLCEDKDGNIWVACGGLSKYNERTGNFANWHHDVKNKFSLPYDNVKCLIPDKSGKIWIGTDTGLCFYEAASGKFTPLSEIIYPDTLCSSIINCLMIDHEGLLWIGTENGINIYDAIHKKLELFTTIDKNTSALNKTVSCIMEDHSGDVWISLWNSGLYRYNPSTGVSKIYRHSATDSNSLSSNLVNTLLEDNHHAIWAGTSFAGISIYQPATDNFRTHRANVEDSRSLITDQIENLYEDRSGVLWIGTHGAGLDACYLTARKFMVYHNWDKEYISHWPLSLYKDHAGKIYMTTHGTGLQEFNPVTGKFKSYNIVLPNDSLSFANISFGTIEASDGNFWMVTYAEGLHKFNLKTRAFTTIHSANTNHHTNFNNESNCIVEDFNKRLWIGTSHGLKCYDLKTKIFSGFENLYRDTNQLSNDGIENLYCDAEGILWIAGENGLTLFNTKSGQIKIYRHDDNNIHSISNNTLNYLYDDGKGIVWIGTDGGLERFDKKTEQFRAYTMKDGLPDNSIKGILADDDSNLWLSSNKGICKLTLPSGKNSKAICRNYDLSDGLPGDEYDFNTCVKADDGTLYFASTGGLVAFKPDELKDNQFIPPVVITDFSLFNKSIVPYDSTGVLALPVDETKEIKLSYKQNDFSFTFAALSYVHPEKNQYAYKLERYNSDWIYTDATKRFANYTHLDAGEYTFEVKASNNDGVWNETPTTIKLIITPPYWQTWWFYTLCALAVAFILYAIYRYRVQQVIKLQMIRNNIASDLHDDIGSTLNSISVFSEVAKQQAGKNIPALDQIGESARKIVESMSDIVWTINPENDNFEKIIVRMRSFAYQVLKAKKIELVFRADENLNAVTLPMQVRKNFYLIFKEATNNMVKYSNAGRAAFHITWLNRQIKLEMRDNGMGFNLQQHKPGNGIKNMRRRANEIGAQLIIESEEGDGTSIELTLKTK